jgi:hypothetical protein
LAELKVASTRAAQRAFNMVDTKKLVYFKRSERVRVRKRKKQIHSVETNASSRSTEGVKDGIVCNQKCRKESAYQHTLEAMKITQILLL